MRWPVDTTDGTAVEGDDTQIPELCLSYKSIIFNRGSSRTWRGGELAGSPDLICQATEIVQGERQSSQWTWGGSLLVVVDLGMRGWQDDILDSME